MERSAFTQFVSNVLDEIIELAEAHVGRELPRPPRFQWAGRPLCETEDVVETIVDRVYSSPDRIRPCIDIGVMAIDSAGRPLVVASVSGHEPRPFGRNWTGRPGPFVYYLGSPLLNDISLDSVVPGAVLSYSVVPFDESRSKAGKAGEQVAKAAGLAATYAAAAAASAAKPSAKFTENVLGAVNSALEANPALDGKIGEALAVLENWSQSHGPSDGLSPAAALQGDARLKVVGTTIGIDSHRGAGVYWRTPRSMDQS